MSETCSGHLWEKIIVKLFASSWYIFLTYIYMMHGHTYIKWYKQLPTLSSEQFRLSAVFTLDPTVLMPSKTVSSFHPLFYILCRFADLRNIIIYKTQILFVFWFCWGRWLLWHSTPSLTSFDTVSYTNKD